MSDLGDAILRRQRALEDLAAAEADLRRAAADARAPERPMAHADMVSQAIVGAILDFPSLRDDAECAEAIARLTGDALAAVKATGPEPDYSVDLSSNYLLWVMDRIEKPQHRDIDIARAELIGNGEKLRYRELSRQKARAEQASAAAEARGEDGESFNLLREAQEAARKKQELRARR